MNRNYNTFRKTNAHVLNIIEFGLKPNQFEKVFLENEGQD